MIRHILAAVDFDPISERALAYAMDLAKHMGARVTALHVYGLPVYAVLPGEASILPSAEQAAKAAEAAQKGLDALIAPHADKGVALDGKLRVGASAEEICNEAKALGVDLIVVGTHGRGAIKRALLGSVAQTVLRDAHVPVMVVRKGD